MEEKEMTLAEEVSEFLLTTGLHDSTTHRLRTALARESEKKVETRWISVERDGMPPEGVEVLVWSDEIQEMGFDDSYNGDWFNNSIEDVTHWSYRPAPPERKREEANG